MCDNYEKKFNTYYINSEKASELSMLFDNEIVERKIIRTILFAS